MLARQECQQHWKIDYVDGKRRKNYGVHMDFGTAIHETIELFHCKKPDPSITTDIAVFLFKEKFKYLFEKHFSLYEEKEHRQFRKPVEEGGLRQEFFLDAGERIIRRFDECDELRTAQVMFNEYQLYDDIERSDDIKIKFKGFIDLVIRTKDKRGNSILYVCDFKTCSWGWPREKREDKNLHFQILLYKHFICKKFGLDPSQVRTAFVLLKKKPKVVDKKTGETESPIEWFPISAGPVSTQRAVDELNRDITELDTRLKNGTIKKNLKSCVNKYGDVCPYLGTPHCDSPIPLPKPKP